MVKDKKWEFFFNLALARRVCVMETTTFHCPNCNTTLNVPEKAASKIARCGKCRKLIKVPALTFGETPEPSNGRAVFAQFLPLQTALGVKIKSLVAAAGHYLDVQVKTKPWVVVIAAACLGSLVFLGLVYNLFTGPPWETTIKQAITVYVKAHSVGHMNFMASQSNIKLDTLTIKEVGKFNQEKKYWPVRAAYTGSYLETRHQFLGTDVSERHEFRGEDEFAISQDDFGKWEATVIRRR